MVSEKEGHQDTAGVEVILGTKEQNVCRKM